MKTIKLTSICGCKKKYNIEGMSELEEKKFRNKIETSYCGVQCREKDDKNYNFRDRRKVKNNKGQSEHRKRASSRRKRKMFKNKK